MTSLECRPLELSDRDRQVFVDALLKPQPVNDRLRDTVRRYRRATCPREAGSESVGPKDLPPARQE
ncbi:MAG: DUF1778 domain-containing protein [Mesorhizobium sp.]|nr:MAG: DUF1778 domain-containing protein [Mesorhizobium sp.]